MTLVSLYAQRALSVFTIVLGAASLVQALASPLEGQEVPYFTGRVVDLANMLSEADAGRIEERLRSFETETGSQIAVLTIPSLDGYAIEDYSHRVAEAWELGRGEVDDGVLLLIARDERQMRLEVGYGLEGSLTDARSRRVLDNVIQPRFRAGDLPGGIAAGLESVMATIRGEVPEPVARPSPTGGDPAGQVGAVVVQILLFLAVMFIIARIRRRQRRTWSSRSGWDPRWSQRPRRSRPIIFVPPSGRTPRQPSRRRSGGGFGGFGGGGFSGGGGGFGGGGASGGW